MDEHPEPNAVKALSKLSASHPDEPHPEPDPESDPEPNPDEEHDVIYSKQLRRGKRSAKVEIASGRVNVLDTINIIDTYDRGANATAEGLYAQAGTYASAFEDEPGKRVPKAGAFAEAGVGRARAEFSVFEAEAKGPNASASADVNVVGVGAIARAELGSVSAKVGPIAAKLGLGVDTGATVSAIGAEVKLLGTGFSVGAKNSISLLGSEVSCSVM